MSEQEQMPWLEGKPYKGRIFAAVYPHSDDFSINSAALIMKLIYEGYIGYFIRTTNDEMDSYDMSAAETMFRIEKETEKVAQFFGIKKVYNLDYKNHYLNHSMIIEIRHRLITLFRFLKVDTIISFDPYGHYEENPDHYITAVAVEQACWMAGRQLDLPELKDMGIQPHFVTEKFYFARGPQLSNVIIDVSRVRDKKIEAIELHETPIDNMWKEHLYSNGGNAKYDSKHDFIIKSKLDNKSHTEGLFIYEKYHHIVKE